MSYSMPPDDDSNNYAETAPAPPAPADLSSLWPVAAGVAAAVFVADAVVKFAGGSLGSWVMPGFNAAVYLIIAFRVHGKASRTSTDFVLMAVCALSLPLFYAGAFAARSLEGELGALNVVLSSVFGTAFAIAYFAYCLRTAYPKRSKDLDWGLIVPVLIMSAAMGLFLFVELAAVLLRSLDLSTEIPITLPYTFSSVIYFFNSLIVIVGAIIRTNRTGHPADIGQIIARVMVLVLDLFLQFATRFLYRFVDSMGLGMHTIIEINVLAIFFFNLVFAVAFFASPDPQENYLSETGPEPV